jgi:hypothetical protein
VTAPKAPAKKAATRKPAAKRPTKQAKPESIIAIRESIRARLLVRKLEQFALGEDGTELSVAQISAMKILLDRRLPSLRAMEVTGQADTNITISWQK